VVKTALAVHWAHRVRDRFPDGQLYANLHGFDPNGPPVPPGRVVGRFLDALGVPARRLPVDPDARADLYRSLLAGRRVLVVLDNVRDADQVRPLLPGVPGCLTLVTSRSRLTGLVAAEGAYPLPVELPEPDEARRLLAVRLAAHPVAAPPGAVDELVDRCGRLPLALAVAAGAAINRGLSLADLAGWLREATNPLDVLAGVDPATDVRAALAGSYAVVSADAARLFRLLGTHPAAEIGSECAAGLAWLRADWAGELLAELTDAQLLAEPVPGRYVLHPLLRAYAAELAPVPVAAGPGARVTAAGA